MRHAWPVPSALSEQRLNTNASHASQLRVISLFEELQPAELLHVASLCTMQASEKHTQIMGEQDQTTDVFFILAGTVRISSYTEAGREVIFTEMSAGDIFGEFSAVDRLPRSASIVALTDCVLARMPSAKFFEVLRSHADISVRLIELLVSKIRKMSERVFEVSALGVRERVRRELLRLASEGESFPQRRRHPAGADPLRDCRPHRLAPRGRDSRIQPPRGGERHRGPAQANPDY